jgi:transposase
MNQQLQEPAGNRFHPTPASIQLAEGIVIGIDPGLDAHGVVAMLRSGSRRLKAHRVPNTIAGMQFLVQCLSEWKQQCGGNLLIGMEEASAFGEPLECYLHQAGFEIVTVSAFQVSRYREVAQIDANDSADAEAVARLLMVQPDLARQPAQQLTRRDPQGTACRRLRQLARRHHRLTSYLTRTCNELHALLRLAWLCDYQQFFSEVQGAAALAFWQQYPTPAEAAQADPEALAALLHETSRKRIKLVTARETARRIVSTAQFMVTGLGRQDPQRWSGWAVDIRQMAKHLAALVEQVNVIDREMENLLDAMQEPLTSFKGLGTVIAGTIIGETLSIQRFPSADHFARYNGTAPRESSSGRTIRHVKNRQCNPRLKRAFLQLALNAPKYHPESQQYVDQLKRSGIKDGAARLRLARRLSDLIYAMLKNNRKYDVEYHREHRRKKSA